MAWLVRN